MVINHYSSKTMEEKIHTYLQLVEYVYESNKYEKDRKELISNEEADSNIRETIGRQEG